MMEQHGGKFPLWLSQIKAIILPIAERNAEYEKEILAILVESGVRAKANIDNETLQAKIRQAQLQKIPYMLVVGDKERVNKTVSIRSRDSQSLATTKLDKFIEKVSAEVEKEKNA